MAGSRENYGIDAPTVVRGLGIGGVALLVLGLVLRPYTPWFGPPLQIGTGLLIGCGWMLISSLWLKQIVMRRLLAERQWRGDEAVLDVGAGRGLVAIGAARRAPQGRIHALDIWQSVDLSGNRPEGLIANAEAAGVAARVTVVTGDARSMPLADASFDVVASMTALHNISDAEGRRAAVAEIWRVTRPGGQILIFDIHHARAYLAQLRALGGVAVKLTGPIVIWGPLGWRFSVSKPG